jgi:hypothetical protein
LYNIAVQRGYGWAYRYKDGAPYFTGTEKIDISYGGGAPLSILPANEEFGYTSGAAKVLKGTLDASQQQLYDYSTHPMAADINAIVAFNAPTGIVIDTSAVDELNMLKYDENLFKGIPIPVDYPIVLDDNVADYPSPYPSAPIGPRVGQFVGIIGPTKGNKYTDMLEIAKYTQNQAILFLFNEKIPLFASSIPYVDNTNMGNRLAPGQISMRRIDIKDTEDLTRNHAVSLPIPDGTTGTKLINAAIENIDKLLTACEANHIKMTVFWEVNADYKYNSTKSSDLITYKLHDIAAKFGYNWCYRDDDGSITNKANNLSFSLLGKNIDISSEVMQYDGIYPPVTFNAIDMPKTSYVALPAIVLPVGPSTSITKDKRQLLTVRYPRAYLSAAAVVNSIDVYPAPIPKAPVVPVGAPMATILSTVPAPVIKPGDLVTPTTIVPKEVYTSAPVVSNDLVFYRIKPPEDTIVPIERPPVQITPPTYISDADPELAHEIRQRRKKQGPIMPPTYKIVYY